MEITIFYVSDRSMDFTGSYMQMFPLNAGVR